MFIVAFDYEGINQLVGKCNELAKMMIYGRLPFRETQGWYFVPFMEG